ncbi:MAG: TonB-dependent receptor [Pseudohongiella sp.]|nr:TonB-dependent receptor [Pseudohongiella sp.]
MPQLNKRGHLRYLIHTSLVASLALPVIAQAQDDDIEEVVVTGSYIRNSAFNRDSNVDTITAEDLFESGAPSMANYIRDLTYTQNTNVVSNVLGTQDGSQDSVGGSFNLRGLGENSTLQLVDGVRTIDKSVNNALPDLAIQRLEVVLDGGSATYGSDAVAGVVNILALKEFDGFRARTYYQVDEERSMEDMTASFLWGKSFDNGISYVGAFDAKKSTPLMQFERPREWSMDNGSSSSGNPGAWRKIVGADPGVNLGGFHNGSSSGGNIIDPACGLVDGPAHGTAAFNTPSGQLTNNVKVCRFEYTKQFQYRRENTDFLAYNSVSWEATDWLRFNLSMNNSYRITDGRTTSTTATSTNNRRVLLVRADHPANPFGFDVSPWNWRLMTEAYDFSKRPSQIEGSTGARKYETHDINNRIILRTEFDMTDTWSGYAYYAKAQHKTAVDSHSIHLQKLQLALAGMGGPNGDEYYNPFGSADPRSPLYVEGVTSNSAEMQDWVFFHNKNQETARDWLDIAEFAFNGEIMRLPAGALLGAFGFQWRDVTERDIADPLDAAGYDYNTAVGAVLPSTTEYYSATRSVFAELEVPILENLIAQLAVRHEQFTDFGLEATTPKIALRWEALPTLAVRASWGESFLAPTPTQARPFFKNENCTETFSGNDYFTGLPMTGSTRCSSGNPNLAPETSTITNVGFTWQPSGDLTGLELSMDYQEVEYVDRIRTLSEQDTVRFEFDKMLAATGISASAYDPTPGSSNRLAAEAWYATRAASTGNPADRFQNFELDRIFLQSANVSSVYIDLIDTKISYDWDTNDWGSFRAAVNNTVFTTYEYKGLGGGVTDALGAQNADSGIVPPLPDFKTNVRLNWFMNNQSASLSANYWSDVDTDGPKYDNYGDGWVQPNTIDGEWRVNVQYAYIFSDFFDSEFTVSAGVTNLFDKRPQRLPITGGFETRLSTPWGRQAWLSVDWTPNN